MRWFTSDTHFAHKGILEYCVRPWKTTDECREGLVANWNALVKAEDDIYIIGDFCFAGAGYHGELIPRLNGRKHLIKGNHDGFQARRYLAWGFVEVVDNNCLLTLKNGQEVLLCHYPYSGDHTTGERYLERRPVDTGLALIHGHVHQEWLMRGRMLNVGVDAWNWEPATEDQVIEMLRRMP
jgi:calcineurin-like phosphoesterase family protein